MRDIMDSEEKKELQKLRQEKEDILNNLAESESEHAQQSKLLEDFISDVEHQLQCSDIEILQVRLQDVPGSESQKAWKPLPFLSAAVVFLVMTVSSS
jgi:hypothetical protein